MFFVKSSCSACMRLNWSSKPKKSLSMSLNASCEKNAGTNALLIHSFLLLSELIKIDTPKAYRPAYRVLGHHIVVSAKDAPKVSRVFTFPSRGMQIYLGSW